VRQLGDRSVKVREHASLELIRLGRAAKAALVAGSNDYNPEIRTRCRQLLPTALWLDLQARIDAFLADKDGKQEHDLPGLKRYLALVGNTPETRQLFGEILKSDATLVELTEADSKGGDLKAAAARFLARGNQLQQVVFANLGNNQRYNLTVADVACLLFVGTNTNLELTGDMSYPLYNLFYQAPIRTAVTSEKPNDPFKKLLLSWIKTRTDTVTMSQSLNLIVQLDLKECLDLTIGVLRDKQASPHNRGYAASAIGKIGTKKQLAVLEPFLTDTTSLGAFAFAAVQGTTELRDVALAMSIHLSGLKIADFGFDLLANNPSMMFYPGYCGFTDAAKRDAAFAKWKRWTGAQKAMGGKSMPVIP